MNRGSTKSSVPTLGTPNFRRFRILRRVVRWLIALAIMAVLSWFCFIFGGRVLSRIAISQIAQLTNTSIETGSVDFRSNGSVFIEDLVINPYENEDPGRTILRAQKVHARFDLTSLLTLRPQLKRIDVNDFVFSAQYDLDTDRWNLSALKLHVPKSSSEGMPLITLGSGTLQYAKISGSEVKIAATVPLTAKLGFDRQPQRGYSFDFQTATQYGGSGESHLSGFWKPGYLEVAGGIALTDVPELEMAWTIDSMAAVLAYDQNDLFDLDLRIRNLRSNRNSELDRLALIGPGVLQTSTPFTALRRFFNRYSPQGLVDIDCKASGDLNNLSETTLTGSVNCKNAAISYYKSLYPVESIKGKIEFTRNSVTLNNLLGSHGDVKLAFDGWTRGFAPDWKYDIRISSDNMKLDDDLYNALSPAQKKTWLLFSPSGGAGIDYHFTRTSPETKARYLSVDLHGVDALYRTFPYPLKNLTGKLFFDPDSVIISNVVSDADGRRIALDGKVTGRATDRLGYNVSINAKNIPLDPTLQAALPEKQKDLYDQFSPTGLADGDIRVSKSAQPGVAPTFTAELSLKQASLTSESLPPLPVTDITAGAVFTPDLIDIKDFSGRYGDAAVSLKGQIWPGQDDQPSRYALSLELKDTLLNDDLFDLLPESAAKIVEDFQPRGKIDLNAELTRLDPNDPTDYKIVVACLGNSVNLPQFSYPLENVTGTLTITPQAVEFRDVNAVPGDAVWIKSNAAFIKLDGRVSLANNAFRSAEFKLKANDIYFDRRLGDALPAAMRPLYNKLVPPAQFDLDLDQVRITLADNAKKHIDIKGRATLENCSLQISGAKTEFAAELDLDELTITAADDGQRYIDIKTLARLEKCVLPISGAKAELDANLNINARYKTNHGFQNCRLLLDGRTFKILGKTFTNLTTDIDYNAELDNWTCRSLTADCYDGILIGKLEIKKTADARLAYALQTAFQNVDLKKFLSDTKMKSDQDDHTTGKMEGSLNISARLGDSSSRLGACKLSVIDMQVGRLSPLAKLLQVMRFAEPTKFAFDQMFLDSYIKGNNLLIRKLDLSGRSAAFYGSGLMDLRTRKIDLGLIARGPRRATAGPSFIGSLAEGLGQAVLKIDVIGDFYDPQVITKPLPLIKSTLEILGKPIEQK